MTSERSLWHTTRRFLAPYGVLERIENASATGTPDVAYCLRGRAGWLELKECAWPKRPSTSVVIQSLKLEQVMFLERWTAARGAAYLLLQGGRDYLLLEAWVARKIFERAVCQHGLREAALAHGVGRFPLIPILKVLA